MVTDMRNQWDFDNMSDDMLQHFASQLVTLQTTKAERLASLLAFGLQDKQYMEGSNMKPTKNTGGTHLQGKLAMPYSELVQAFGKPHYEWKPTDLENKIDVEWAFEFEDGTIATLYNWKNGYAYCGTEGLPLDHITEWNVGGHSVDAVHRMAGAFNAKKEATPSWRTSNDDDKQKFAFLYDEESHREEGELQERKFRNGIMANDEDHAAKIVSDFCKKNMMKVPYFGIDEWDDDMHGDGEGDDDDSNVINTGIVEAKETKRGQ